VSGQLPGPVQGSQSHRRLMKYRQMSKICVQSFCQIIAKN
jgi:hypothetical protein